METIEDRTRQEIKQERREILHQLEQWLETPLILLGRFMKCVLLLDALEGTSDKYEKAKRALDGGNLYQSFIQDGLLTDELISAALCLAHLERTRRSGAFNEADLVTLLLAH
jgi:hypothetical protein